MVKCSKLVQHSSFNKVDVNLAVNQRIKTAVKPRFTSDVKKGSALMHIHNNIPIKEYAHMSDK